jgi:hypothetical protein
MFAFKHGKVMYSVKRGREEINNGTVGGLVFYCNYTKEKLCSTVITQRKYAFL